MQTIPLKKHWRQLHCFENTFTGAEAVDHLSVRVFHGQAPPRDSIRRLLQCFLDWGYVVGMRNEETRNFFDNSSSIYSLCEEKIRGFLDNMPSECKTQQKHRRRSSFNTAQLPSYNSNKHRQCGKLRWPEEEEALFLWQISGEVSDSGCSAEESLQDADTMEQAPGTPIKQQLGRLRVSRLVAGSPALFRKKLILLSSKVGTAPSTSYMQPEDEPKRQTTAIEVDESKVWQFCHLQRLRQANLGVEVGKLLPHDLSGADIRWNCKKLSERGRIVMRPDNEKEELPASLVQDLKKLCKLFAQFTPPVDSVAPSGKALFDELIKRLEVRTTLLPPEVVSGLGHFFECMHAAVPEHATQTPPLKDQHQLNDSTISRVRKSRDTIGLDIAEPAKHELLLFAVRLILLAIKPIIRRRLQIVMKHVWRFLKSLSWQPAWREYGMDWDMAIRKLAPLVFPPVLLSDSIPLSRQLFIYLLTNLKELLFVVPEWLEVDVGIKMQRLISGEETLTQSGEIVSKSARRSIDCSVFKQEGRRSHGISPIAIAESYCTRVDEGTYEEQRKAQDQQLLKLLDDTIADENMDPARKADLLKTFQVTYPTLYSIRFPWAADARGVIGGLSSPQATSGKATPGKFIKQLESQFKRLWAA